MQLQLVHSAPDPEPDPVEIIDTGGWQQHGNCLGIDPDLFFPSRGDSTAPAKEVCEGCQVRPECLDYALVNGEKYGIWGGASERERRRMRRTRTTDYRAALVASIPPLGIAARPTNPFTIDPTALEPSAGTDG
jgi:WhiB family redox-sensing transcriptional regulator